MPDGADFEARLRKVLIEKGLVTPEQIVEALRVRAAAGPHASSLGATLVQLGFITSDLFDATTRVTQDRTVSTSRPNPTVVDLPPNVNEAAKEPANRFGRYVRTECLGSGGMGEVWKAWDTDLNRWVALKFLRQTESEEIARFKREAQTAAKLNHPNIATVYEVGESNGQRFLAMQFIDGQTLSTMPRNDRDALVRTICEVARAVHYAHSSGIIHRDLKPANIMVETSGRAFVVDFGLAKQAKVSSDLSVTGIVVGTPAYMSPEQARGRTTGVDHRTDVYSLGATLYELLSDRAPFRDDDVYNLLRRVIEEDALPVRRRNARVEPDLETIVMKCLEKDPARRYENAAALADDLDCFLKREPISAHPPSTMYRLRNKLYKNRRAVMIAVAAALVGVSVVGAVLLPPLLRRGEALSLVEELNPLKEAIQDARPFFYISGGEIFTRLDRIRSVLEKKSDLDSNPRLKSNPEAWGIVGMGWYFLGDLDRAEAALRRAVGLRPDDPQANFYLGRIYGEKSLLARHSRGVFRQKSRNAEAKKWIHAATQRLDKATGGWLGPRPVDFKILEGYGLLVDDRISELRTHCRESLKTLGEELGAEDLHFLLALCTEGVGEFDRGLQRRPHSGMGFFLRGNRWLRLKDPGKAMGDFEQAERNGFSALLLMINRASARASLKDFVGALRELDAAVERYPTSPECYMFRGRVKAAQGNIEGGIRDCDEALRCDPEFVDALNERAGIYRRSGRGERALQDFDEAIRLEPEDPGTRCNKGSQLLAMNRPKDARDSLDAALRIIPNHAGLLWRRGAARTMLGDTDGAIEDLEKSILADPGIPEAHYQAAHVYASKNELALAKLAYSRGLALRPDADVLRGRAALFVKEGDLEQAEKDLLESLRLLPENVEALIELGAVHYQKGEVARAAEDLSEVIRLQPTRAGLYYERGKCFERLRRMDEAIADFSKCIEMQFDLADSYMSRGAIRALRSEWPAAEADFTEVLRITPGAFDPLMNRALARSFRNLEGSLADYSAALETKPDDLEALHLRGKVHRLLGHKKEAIADFKRALSLAPDEWPERQGAAKELAELEKGGAPR